MLLSITSFLTTRRLGAQVHRSGLLHNGELHPLYLFVDGFVQVPQFLPQIFIFVIEFFVPGIDVMGL